MHEAAWLAVWGKSERDEHGNCSSWLPLHQHLDDAAAVAGELIDQWVAEQVIRRIGTELPDGADGVRRLACWLAAVHDVGKCSPAFAVQVPELSDHMREYGLSAHRSTKDDPCRRTAGHAIVGNLAVREWLADELGFAFRGIAGQLGAVVGSHHGIPPEHGQLSEIEHLDHLVGTGVWAEVRAFLLNRATNRVGGREVFARYREIQLSQPSQVLLTAIVIMADWIASNPDLFPLRPFHSVHHSLPAPDDQATAGRIKAAWSRLSLPPRWAARPLGTDLDQVFRERFGRPTGSARAVQTAAAETAREQSEPGMIVIEAPMGSGKTEAALLAAEQLAHPAGANGCFIALPTQATSDAMFTRVRDWLATLPGRAPGANVTLSLAHGRAHLNDTYTGLVQRGNFTSIGDDPDCDDGTVIAHWWLRSRKKSGLASFVVGTIDQVLFAGLKSRHLMLRHLALAGKVVIIDEVHAYDVYMSQYLHRVLHWLGAYGVPVVLLSATLPDRRRAELLRAYTSGRNTATEPVTRPGYPVITSSDGQPPRVLPPTGAVTTVRMDRLADDLDTLVEYLCERLAGGGCAVVVRNTVSRVQDTAERLTADFGAEQVTINHSRFLACDRAANDRDLVHRFGPPDGGSDRPHRHIVVASQVVEQSLDLDFDLMVTDLAPADLLLQRMGRLHRHERPRPAGLGQARCAVVGVDWQADPVVPVAGSRAVYDEHTLLRAAALLVDRAELRLPDDIAPIVQLAYDDQPIGPDSWQSAMHHAAQRAATTARCRADNARTYLLKEVTNGDLVGWVSAGVGDAEDTARGAAQVRDSDESLEVLVVQRDRDGGLLIPDWVGGGQLPLDEPVPGEQARAIAATALRLPPALCHGGVIDQVIAELEGNRLISFESTPELKGQLVLVLDQDRRAELHGYRLTYDLRRGLVHERA